VRGDLLDAVVQPMWDGLRTPYEPDERLAALTSGQRAVYALRWVVAEVNNGGFDQLFFNSTGYLLPEAQEAARVLGSDAWAAVLDEAAAVLGEPYPRDRSERQERLDALPQASREGLDRLDELVYSLQAQAATDPDALSRAYLERHPDEFFTDE
jgi:hypothetical protein